MISRTTFCSAQGVGDPPGPDPTDTAHVAQPFGLRLDDVEHLDFAKRPDQLAGVDRADAPDHARPEILPFSLGLRRNSRSGTNPAITAVPWPAPIHARFVPRRG